MLYSYIFKYEYSTPVSITILDTGIGACLLYLYAQSYRQEILKTERHRWTSYVMDVKIGKTYAWVTGLPGVLTLGLVEDFVDRFI